MAAQSQTQDTEFIPWPEGNRDFTAWEQAQVRRVRRLVDEDVIGGERDGEITRQEYGRLAFVRWCWSWLPRKER